MATKRNFGITTLRFNQGIIVSGTDCGNGTVIVTGSMVVSGAESSPALDLYTSLSGKYAAVIDNDQNEKRKAKNRALILIGFAGGFRRSELVAIHFEDIDFVPEGVKIFIKRSKTDQSGEGMIKALPYLDNKEFCAVTFLKQWIALSEIKSGLIFNISL